VDYEAVMNFKLAFIKQIYPSQKTTVFKNKEYQQFFAQNKHWLEPYAVFCYLRDQNGTPDFNKWPAFNVYRAEDVAALIAENAPSFDAIAINYFIQYHLHLQLQEAAKYAHESGIILKGDIAIGVYRYGADTWQQPELYHMNMQAGAPPDDFAVKGQNWGFPTYNWQRMKEDGFAWWKNRFEQMSYYFDAFRIDHILGFFRIWSIPVNSVEGIMGYFVPAIPVHVNEFHNRGVWFDFDRYTKPFINEHVLWEIFGYDVAYVKDTFLNYNGFETYSLKTEFNTQKKVEQFLSNWNDDDFTKKMKTGLFDLISNVILFEVEDSQKQQFHFRFSLSQTTSFQSLDRDLQNRLDDLYVNYFFRRQDHFWMKEASQKLPSLKRVTNMLVCGEDLGLVPDCVPDLMKQLGLLSLEIQRMPKDPKREFSNPADAPYLSVVTPSTHDMSTIRGWWEEDRARIEKFYYQSLNKHGDVPQFCEPWINKEIVQQHLFSPAMWCIFQLQDWMGIDGKLRRQNPNDERINVPANPKNYWRYRMHITLENLLEQTEFNQQVADAISISGR
jgi:4-alpha-glucanotransferase